MCKPTGSTRPRIIRVSDLTIDIPDPHPAFATVRNGPPFYFDGALLAVITVLGASLFGMFAFLEANAAYGTVDLHFGDTTFLLEGIYLNGFEQLSAFFAHFLLTGHVQRSP